jgi:uracil-DNA glycosylase
VITRYNKWNVNSQWEDIVQNALGTLDKAYWHELCLSTDWLPGLVRVLAAFSRPLNGVRYVLIGESPYPRAESANGYAFWDNAVVDLWGVNGLSARVNRATSLRNFIKMLLVAGGDLSQDVSAQAIMRLDVSRYHTTLSALFERMLASGFVLLNASLVYRESEVMHHAKQWQPFILSVLTQLSCIDPTIRLVLFGRVAEKFVAATPLSSVHAPHPYNLSFIHHPDVIALFKPLNLLLTG